MIDFQNVSFSYGEESSGGGENPAAGKQRLPVW